MAEEIDLIRCRVGNSDGCFEIGAETQLFHNTDQVAVNPAIERQNIDEEVQQSSNSFLFKLNIY
jgi:hypothetical protein